MSTILDALSKAERERRLGSLPDLHFSQIAAGTGRRQRHGLPPWLLAAGAAGLIGAAAVWWAMQPVGGQRVEATVPTASQQTTDAGAANPAGTVGRDAAATAERSDSDAQMSAATGDKRAPLRSGVAWSTRPDARGESTQPRSRSPVAKNAEAGTDATSGEVAESNAAKDGAGKDGAGKGGAAQAGAAQDVVENGVARRGLSAQSGTATNDDPSTASSVGRRTPNGLDGGSAGRETAEQARPVTTGAPLPPDAQQLPVAIRNQLPQLKIGGYIYSAKPAERSVLINNKLLREGDSIAPELQLEQLRPDGVILNYRGHRYRLGY